MSKSNYINCLIEFLILVVNIFRNGLHGVDQDSRVQADRERIYYDPR